MVETPGRGPGGSRFESGRSPLDAGDLEISEVSYASQAGSIPAPATTGRWRNLDDAAPASEAGGWEFESLRPDPCEVVERIHTWL